MTSKIAKLLVASVALGALSIATDAAAARFGGGGGGQVRRFGGGQLGGAGFGHFGGARFGGNAFGAGWSGWVGPVFWPYLYGDVLTFALWPYDYYDPFLSYGPDFILTNIFWPDPFLGASYAYGTTYWLDDIYGGFDEYRYGGSGGNGYHRHHPTGVFGTRGFGAETMGSTTGTNNLAQICSGLAPGVADLPISRVEQAVHPTGDQVAALDNLKSASSEARHILQLSCPSDVPLTPVSRLDSVEKRLAAMVQAAQIVRNPLASFYTSLTDEQRQRFDALGTRTNRRSHKIQMVGAASANALAAVCSQRAESFTQPRSLERIEQTVRPTEQQKGALNDLKEASSEAAKQLQAAACPTETPQIPMDRLDAVEKRLDAMAQAVKTVRAPLDKFYASLSDEQKAQFNIMGSAQSSGDR
jgi:LTXXQ motif family protein